MARNPRRQVPPVPPRGRSCSSKGESALPTKCSVERRSYAPGQHGQKSWPAPVRLRYAAAREAEDPPHLRRARAPVPQVFAEAEPQKTRPARTCSSCSRAASMPSPIAWAGASRAEARQIVRHNGVLINGRA